MKKSIIVLILISIASVLFSCSDELINEKTDGDLTNEVSPYLKALKKLHRSGNITGHNVLTATLRNK